MAEEILDSITEEQPAADLKPASPFKKWYILVPGIILLMGVQVVMAYFVTNTLFFSDPPEDLQHLASAGTAGDSSPASPEAAEFDEEQVYSFEDIIVNPAGTMGRRYLVISLSFLVDEKKVMEEISMKDPLIRDKLITTLSAKSLDYVSDVQNLEAIRGDIKEAINNFLQEGNVTKVYFTSYVLQ